MKTPVLHLLGLLVLITFVETCDDTPVVGSDDVFEYENVQFTVDSTYIVGSEFRATGKIKNRSRTKMSPVWYVEGSFFSDDDLSVKFGGDNTSFSFALERNQTTLWTLRFKRSDLNPTNYPDFAVSELRAFRNSAE